MWSISSIWPSIGLLDFGKGMVMSLYNMMSTGTSFDSWLTTDTEAERYAAGEDQINEHVQYLMNHDDDYNHTLFENFIEDLNSASLEQANTIEEYLRNKEFEKLGRFVYCLSLESREEHAKIQAQLDFDNGELDD
jgi:hypothetical protein